MIVVRLRSTGRYSWDSPTVTPAPTGPTRTPTSSASAGAASAPIRAAATRYFFMVLSSGLYELTIANCGILFRWNPYSCSPVPGPGVLDKASVVLPVGTLDRPLDLGREDAKMLGQPGEQFAFSGVGGLVPDRGAG